MRTVPLHIQNAQRPQRPPVAWFVPGDDPQSWLERLCAAGLVGADVRLWIVPRAPDDLRPLGVLVRQAFQPDRARAAMPEPHATAPGPAYGRAAGRLYLPVEAILLPDLSDSELEALLIDADRHYVWHPAAGLVGFDPDDERRLRDLFQPPASRPACWDAARPGVAFARRLLSVEAEACLTLEIVLEQARDDIGEHGGSLDQLEKLPPSPEEPPTGALSHLGRGARQALARVVQWLTSHAPAGSPVPTWVNALADWAQRQLERAGAASEAARNREVLRLLHMLETDPDEGLRHAIPFGEIGAHRGEGPPGDRLIRHDTDFSLSRLAGGRPIDPWDLLAEHQLRLAAAYREAAARELRLGRFRRAAYIYAELLGDLEAAAAALKAGGHYREAAVLYRDRLQRPREAAECLVQGGLLAEAIALYEELEDFVRVGDLHARLDQPEEARNAWRRAVDQRRTARDYLGAAALLEHKLHEPQQALDCLDEGWRHSEQPGECLDELFRLVARLGDHAQALSRIGGLKQARGAARHAGRDVLAAEMLARTARDYPDVGVRAAAADAARVIAGTRLRRAPPDLRRRLVAAVTQLAPQDRLLERDGARYVRQADERDARTPRPPRSAWGESLRLVEVIRLPGDVVWQQAASAGDVFYAVGYDQQSPGRLVLARGFWGNPLAEPALVSWQLASTAEPPVLLAVDPLDRHPVFVQVPGHQPLARRTLPPAWGVAPGQTAGTPDWIPRHALVMVRGEHGYTWVLDHGGLHCCALRVAGPPPDAPKLHLVRLIDDDADLISAFLDQILESASGPAGTCGKPDVPGSPSLSMFARARCVYLGVQDSLYRYTPPGETLEHVPVPGPIRSLTGSPPHTRPRLVAALDRGAVLWFEERSLHEPIRIAAGVEQPVCGHTHSGSLVIAGENRCELYRTAGRQVIFGAELDLAAPAPIAVLAGRPGYRFALVAADGTLRVYEAYR